jgi:hypothetical protein
MPGAARLAVTGVATLPAISALDETQLAVDHRASRHTNRPQSADAHSRPIPTQDVAAPCRHRVAQRRQRVAQHVALIDHPTLAGVHFGSVHAGTRR